MTTWALDIRRGWKWGLALLGFLLVLAAMMITVAAMLPLSFLTFLLGMGAAGALGMALYLGYLLWGLVHAVYALDRNGLYIAWGGYEYTIPLEAIEQVGPPSAEGKLRWRPGLHWPGYFVGAATDGSGRLYRFLATQPAEGQLWIRTARCTYVISPQDAEGFLEALESRRAMGPTQQVEEAATHPAFFDWPIWQDRSAVSLFLSTLLLLLLFVAYLCYRIPHLPDSITLQWSPDGEPLLTAAPTRLFYLAVMGLLFLVGNGALGLRLYRREPRLAYFLWSAMLLLQTALWVALLTILWRV